MPKIEVGNTFLANRDTTPAIGELVWRGDAEAATNDNDNDNDSDADNDSDGDNDGDNGGDADPAPYYRHPHGTLWVGDSLRWLETLDPGSIDLFIADPPYNLGKAEWDSFASQDEYLDWSMTWIERAARALAPHGSLYVCGFSEILADLRRPAMRHFASCRWLVWFYKNKANLRNDWGRSHESILHLRKSRKPAFHTDDVRIPYSRHTLKYPSHPQATSSQYSNGKKRAGAWRPHPRGAKPKDVFEIPVTSNGMAEKTPHPTQKPEELVRKLVLASSAAGQVVADPFAGAGTTLVCAEQLGRRWLGCELSPQYCHWSTLRLASVERRTVDEWIEFDRANAARRTAIR